MYKDLIEFKNIALSNDLLESKNDKPNLYDLKVNQDDLKAFIEEEAKRYKDPKQFETWVYNQPNQLDQYRMIVLENQLVEKLDNDLKSRDKVINFKDLSKY